MEELQRVLAGKGFADSPRLQQFLRYVVEETLAGRAGRLKGFTIAQEVFQRQDPEDAQTSTIVRVEAGRLRRRLSDYYSAEGKNNPVRIEVPKGGYIPSFEVLGSEESADTNSAEKNRLPEDFFSTTDTPALRRSWMSRTTLLTTAFLFLAGAALIWSIWPGKEQDTAISLETNAPTGRTVGRNPSIAVLEFENLVSGEQGYTLARGITEDIITDLSTLPVIDVIAFSSVLSLENALDIDRITDKLDVTHVLRGSVRGAPPKIRVTAQLYDAHSGKELWADRFDRQLDDMLTLQDELAIKIVEGMSIGLQGVELQGFAGSHTKNTEADNLYKLAVGIVNPPSDPNRLQVARRIFQKVIEIDPGFAGGYAGVAYTHAFNVWWGHSQLREEELENTFALANRAIEINPDFGLAYSAMAFAHLAGRDFDKALASSKLAVRAQPGDPYVMAYHGYLLCTNGESQDGIGYAQRALRLNPLYPRTPFMNILGVILFHAGENGSALEMLQKNLDRGGPDSAGMQAYRAAILASLGHRDEAKIVLELAKMYSNGSNFEQWIRGSFKYQEDAEKVLSQLRSIETEG